MAETFVLFEVAGAIYAVRSAQVERVDMVEIITRVPNAPDFVEGVVSARGQAIPVVSLRRRFHLENIPLDLRSRVVIIRLEGRQVGMLVDAAREFMRLKDEQILPVPEGLIGPGVDYLDGVISLPNRVVLIVNLGRLLNVEERSELASQPTGAA